MFKKLNHYTNDEHSIGVDKFYNTIFLIKKIGQKRVFFLKESKIHKCMHQNTTWD